jgi:hypothetical protein
MTILTAHKILVTQQQIPVTRINNKYNLSK